MANNAVKWVPGAVTGTAIISASSMAAGANVLSSETNNETNEDRFLALELTWTAATANTAGQVVEVYILYSLDGTNYEDGDGSTDPYKAPVGAFVDDGGTGAQKQTIVGIPIAPYKFKVLIKSELTNDCTASSVTLDAETYNEEIQ